MRQYRGCSRFMYATRTVAEDGKVTYGTPKEVAPVKAISIDIAADSEPVFADNIKQDETFAATVPTKNFDTMRIDPLVVAELLGNSKVEFGEKQGVATDPDASARPAFAFGYALHDGDVDNPCEVVWAFNGKVKSISKAANSIDLGTGSEGQTVVIEFSAPEEPFNKTGKRNLDFNIPVNGKEDAAFVKKWFTQVVTPDSDPTTLA